MNRVILADDDPFARRTTSELLGKWGYQVAAYADGNETWLNVDRQADPCVVLLNYRLPQIDGIEICRRLHDRPIRSKRHLILVGNISTRDDVLKAVETFADDYVLKPTDPRELRLRLRLGQRLMESAESVDRQAARDLLTGALNRDAVMRELQNEMDRARRQNAPISVLLASVDNLEKVLNHYGLPTANAVQVETVQRLSEGLRPYDSVGCYNDGQYLLVLPGCELASAEKQAIRLCKALSAMPFNTAQTNIYATCTIGVAGVQGKYDIPPQDLISKAAKALESAKAAGGNRVHLAGA